MEAPGPFQGAKSANRAKLAIRRLAIQAPRPLAWDALDGFDSANEMRLARASGRVPGAGLGPDLADPSPWRQSQLRRRLGPTKLSKTFQKFGPFVGKLFRLLLGMRAHARGARVRRDPAKTGRFWWGPGGPEALDVSRRPKRSKQWVHPHGTPSSGAMAPKPIASRENRRPTQLSWSHITRLGGRGPASAFRPGSRLEPARTSARWRRRTRGQISKFRQPKVVAWWAVGSARRRWVDQPSAVGPGTFLERRHSARRCSWRRLGPPRCQIGHPQDGATALGLGCAGWLRFAFATNVMWLDAAR
jgi:hypothetical protein